VAFPQGSGAFVASAWTVTYFSSQNNMLQSFPRSKIM
jgi:hypothetical protein